jgi:hypothetical protein
MLTMKRANSSIKIKIRKCPTSIIKNSLQTINKMSQNSLYPLKTYNKHSSLLKPFLCQYKYRPYKLPNKNLFNLKLMQGNKYLEPQLLFSSRQHLLYRIKSLVHNLHRLFKHQDSKRQDKYQVCQFHQKHSEKFLFLLQLLFNRLLQHSHPPQYH